MEPFKNLLNKKVIQGMAPHFKRHYPKFDSAGFIRTATKDLNKRELKARTIHITQTMIEYLPKDFEKTGRILMASLGPPLDDDLSAGTIDERGIGGWAVSSLTHYVALRGHNHFDFSMLLLKEMTKSFTAEFDIRFFLIESPKKTLAVLKKWAKDENHHVRRLASEGCRPRLPWGMSLPQYIQNPSPIIKLLELLKDDDKEYVRRSVANNLNDIAKDHPEIVAELATQWMTDASKERQKLIRHACRTLIKNGHKKTLKVFGYKPAKLSQAVVKIETPEVVFGDALEFTLHIESKTKKDQALLIDYIIHHQKANGKTSPKVFKWKTTTLAANKGLSSTKKHPMRQVTTRVYHPGLHTLEVIINGVSMGTTDFQLKIPVG